MTWRRRLGNTIRLSALRRLCVLLMLFVSACKSHDKIINPTQVPFVPSGTSIVFRSTRDGNAEIYRADADTIMRLTHNGFADQEPAWSHDGTRLAFVSTRDGNSEIYVMNADSTGVTRLTNNAAADTHPAWSPGDTAIAFVIDRGGNKEIYVMKANGDSPTNITNHVADDDWPTWSPAGDKIAFHSSPSLDYEIYSMNADGSNQVQLTYSNYMGTTRPNGADRPAPGVLTRQAICPNWSPDGNSIVFVDLYGDRAIAIMPATGGPRLDLTHDFANNSDPVWSPDGTRIAYSSDRDGNFEIYYMLSDGSRVVRLTNNGAIDDSPSWGRLPNP